MKNIILLLQNYKRLVAEIKDISLDIEELHAAENIGPGAITYEERTGVTYKFNSQTENEAVALADKTIRLEKEKRVKEIELERIDNALSILDEKEKQVLELKHIKGYAWKTVAYKLDICYSYCKKIEGEALDKIEPFLNK